MTAPLASKPQDRASLDLLAHAAPVERSSEYVRGLGFDRIEEGRDGLGCQNLGLNPFPLVFKVPHIVKDSGQSSIDNLP